MARELINVKNIVTVSHTIVKKRGGHLVNQLRLKLVDKY